MANLPKSSGGVFVQGGTIGNLSALVAARFNARNQDSGVERWVIAHSGDAHSSIKSAARVMDVDTLTIPSDNNHRLTGSAVASAVDEFHSKNPKKRIFAIVATAGTTNLGIIDDLEGIGRSAN